MRRWMAATPTPSSLQRTLPRPRIAMSRSVMLSRLGHELPAAEDRVETAVLLGQAHEEGAVHVVHHEAEEEVHHHVVDPARALQAAEERAEEGESAERRPDRRVGAVDAETGGDGDEVEVEDRDVGEP